MGNPKKNHDKLIALIVSESKLLVVEESREDQFLVKEGKAKLKENLPYLKE